MSEAVFVSYTNGQAEVQIEGRRLAVARRDDQDRNSICPLELVSAALGS